MTKVILGDRVSSYKVLAVYALLFLNSAAAFSADKLIALTFDDGPRPYVLFGTKDHAGSSLLNVLDDNGVKATFFVVGWRLTPKTWGEPRHEENVGITCIDAAEQVVRRGHELEDHTYSHIELRGAERKRGEQWVIGDVNRAALPPSSRLDHFR
jgi:peptidoglycan/xylan/chitin deacetylase (PgdA/CDA1 family)